MSRLSNEELEFLKHHKVPLSRVFDATGLSKSEYGPVMKSLEMWIAFGTTECREAGHQLRVRSGHCVQCKPANLAYQNRTDEIGEVYVAHSSRRHFTKVGTSKDAMSRVSQLNINQYGRIDDWKLFYKESCARAGSVEFQVHSELGAHHFARRNQDGANSINCQELFGCEPAVAVEVVKAVIARSRGQKK